MRTFKVSKEIVFVFIPLTQLDTEGKHKTTISNVRNFPHVTNIHEDQNSKPILQNRKIVIHSASSNKFAFRERY